MKNAITCCNFTELHVAEIFSFRCEVWNSVRRLLGTAIEILWKVLPRTKMVIEKENTIQFATQNLVHTYESNI